MDDGLAKFQRRMRAIPVAAREAVRPALVAGAGEIADTMRTLAPEDTGALRESIVVTAPGQATPPYSQPGGAHILGESQVVDEGESLHRKRLRLYHTLHVWTKEPGLAGAKGIMGQVRLALAARPALAAPYHCADLWVAAERALRDPDGETGHGVITLEAIVGWS